MASRPDCCIQAVPGYPAARPYRSLIGALRFAAAGSAGICLVGDEDAEERRSYAEILEGARRRAAALRLAGVLPGQRVILVLNTSFEFVESFFGLILAGALPVPAYPPVAMSRLAHYRELLAHIVTVTGASHLITDRKIGLLIGRPGELELLTVEELAGASPARGSRDREPSPAEPCFIQCTSGSTSRPRPVVLSHRAVLANLRGTAAAFELRGDDVFVSWLPLYHDLGLIGALLGAIAGGIELVLLRPDLFLLDPAAWWRAISRHRGTITAAPNFAYGLSVRRLDDEDLRGLDLSCLRIAASGAEPIQPETMRAFARRLAPAGLAAEVVFAAYGLAESCVAVTLSRPGYGLRVDRISRRALADRRRPRAAPAIGPEDELEAVSLGWPILGTRLAIVEPGSGRHLPERCLGEVVVLGESLMTGYLGDPLATRQTLRPDGLHTGDLGYLSDGELFVVGRLKNMLIVRGRNYYAEDIEGAAERVPGVRKGNLIAFGVFDEARGEDRLHLIAETRLTGIEERARLEEALRRSVSEVVGLVPDRVVLVGPGRLPKTSSGKKQRAACRGALLDGSLLRPRWRQWLVSRVLLLGSLLARGLRGLFRGVGLSRPRLSSRSPLALPPATPEART